MGASSKRWEESVPPLGGKGLTDQPKIVCVCEGALALGFGLMSARSFKNYEQGLIKI